MLLALLVILKLSAEFLFNSNKSRQSDDELASEIVRLPLSVPPLDVSVKMSVPPAVKIVDVPD